MEATSPKKNITVHHVLAKSYMVYFLGFLLGVVLDYFFPIPLLENNSEVIGIIILVLATLLILWAQTTSRRTAPLRGQENATEDHTHFHKGPYKVFRSPTHIGLALLLVSYGFLSNSMPITIVAGIVFLATRVTFVMQEEKMLEARYGNAYRKYKDKVPL